MEDPKPPAYPRDRKAEMIQFGDTKPAEAVGLLTSRTRPVEPEEHFLADPAEVVGRFLAEPVRLDRDSPACDVSAMDGYAVRQAELLAGPVPIIGECRIGQPPADLPPAAALKIFTGSPLPRGADTVVRREWVDAASNRVSIREGRSLSAGRDIRRRGENRLSGAVVLPAGAALTTAAIGTLATVGPASVKVCRRLRVTVLTTGDEVLGQQESLALEGRLPDHRLRNSNGPVVASLLRSLPFVGDVLSDHVGDEAGQLADRLGSAVAESDAVVLTGGVSQGEYDLVRGAVEGLGGEVLFHGVAARPGRPTLGAVVGGTPVLGLPGNPVAVMSTSRRLLEPLLRHRAGSRRLDPPAPQVALAAWEGKTLPLAWWRPVKLSGAGLAEIAPLLGSGDVCGPAETDGFIEAPPGADHAGPYPFYAWRP